MYWNEDGAPVTCLSVITTVFGAASGIHGSVFMIRSPALAVGCARSCLVGRGARLVQRGGDPGILEAVVVLAAVLHRERVVERGRIGVVGVVDREEAVDVLARLGVGEEVDVVGRGDGLRACAFRPMLIAAWRIALAAVCSELISLEVPIDDRLAGRARVLDSCLALATSWVGSGSVSQSFWKTSRS